MRLRFLSSGLLLLLSVALSAQPVRDSVTIEVVDVPVFVTRGNQAVEGLTRDDFQLFVNGKPQPVEYFDIVSSSRTNAPATLRERRLFLILFDLAFSPPHALGQAQRAAAELIANAPKSDLFAIAHFSSRRGVTFSTPFIRDGAALARAIASLTVSQAGDPLAIMITSNERAALADTAANLPERYQDPAADQNLVSRISGEAIRDIWQTQIDRFAENQILDFKDLGSRLMALQGQKHVVLLSEGFDTRGAVRVADLRKSGPVSAYDYNFGIDQYGTPQAAFESGVASRPVIRALREMHQAFQHGDILMHTVDLKGVSSMMGSDSLHGLATGTGGKFVHNRNDFGDALVDLSSSLRHGYLLGFKPANVRSGHNSIVVKLREQPRGVTVRHRLGFSGIPPLGEIDDGLYLADVVLNDVPQTGTAATLELRDGTLQARIPMREIAAQFGKRGGKAELLVYIFDARGSAIDFHREIIDVAGGAAEDRTIVIAVPEGALTAKALLRVEDGLGFSKVIAAR